MIFIVLFCCSFLLLDRPVNNKSYTFNVILIIILLSVFLGCRGLSVLNDTAHYYRAQAAIVNNINQFSDIFKTSDYMLFEKGFQIVMNLVAYITPNPYALICISAILFVCVIVSFFYHYTKKIGFCFFLLTTSCLFGIVSAMRQSYALMLIFLAFILWEKQYRIYSLIVIILSTYFHKTSIVIVIVPLLEYYVPLTKKNIFLFFIVAIMLFTYLYPILELMSYSESRYITASLERENTPYAAILNASLNIFLFLAGYNNSKNRHIDFITPLLVWMCLLGLVFSVLGVKILGFGRFDNYFMPFIILYFVLSITGESNKGTMLKSLIVSVMIIRFFVILIYRNEWSHLVPYTFFDFFSSYQVTDFGY